MNNEKITIYGVTSIFSALLVFAFFEFSWVFPYMFKYDWFLSILIFACTAIHISCWYLLVKFFEDPDYDWVRRVSIISGIVAAIVLLAYGVTVKNDIENNIAPKVKTEIKKCNTLLS